MNNLLIKTQKHKEVIDITNEIENILKKEKIKEGICLLFVTHTTCCLTTADLDPGTDKDMLEAFENIVPNLEYRHPHDPHHVGDHIISSLIGPSVLTPFEDGKLILGTWQRIVLIELNGPKERHIKIKIIK